MVKPRATGSETLPEGSMARGKHTDPAARAAEHAEKQRQFNARKAGTPGPGTYSPARPASTVAGSSSKKASVGSTASFASKSKRIWSEKADQQGDPGAYDPGLLKNLAITSKKSASKLNRSGTGSFGGQEQRKIAIEIMGEATPGPGAYNGETMLRSGKKAALSALDSGEKMPMSSFKSTSVQRAKTLNQHVPGAGAYTPNHAASEPNTVNPAAGMRAKGPRFKGADAWERNQAAEPGPGAYEIEFLRSGARSSVASAVSGGFGNKAQQIAFGTDAMRELPWEC